jgi:maltose O-acetyltransferase
LLRHFINSLLFLLPPSRLFWFRSCLLRLGNVEVGSGVRFCGGGWIYGRGKLTIGTGTWLSPGVTVYTHVNAPITVGARCDIGPQVSFIPGTHQIGDRRRRAGVGIANPITVEDGCWIGAGTIVLGGVTIGAGSVVGAGATVTADVRPNSLVGGVPAKPIRDLAP